MPRFVAVVKETTYYDVPFEADDAAQADEMAEEILDQAIDDGELQDYARMGAYGAPDGDFRVLRVEPAEEG